MCLFLPKSSLYTAYTSNLHKYIDTLSELDASGLNILASSPALLNTFGDNSTNSPLLRSLERKIIVIENSPVSPLNRTASSRDSCSLERFSDIKLKIEVFLFCCCNFEQCEKTIISTFFRRNIETMMALQCFT